MSPDYPHLLSPVRIGAMALRNRLVMSPMENQYETPDGTPSQRSIDFYLARARGGVGLITLGASSVDRQHTEIPQSIHFGDDSVIDAHRALTDAVHAEGAKIQPQLAHAGPDGLGPELHGVEALGPSAIQSYLTRTTSRAVGADEFALLVDRFRAAAVRIRAAGYDGIELHAAHGYMLLGSFLTPWRNARKDAYAAHGLEGRARAVVEVVRAIKREVGEDFPITLRVSGYERVPGGRALTDTAQLAPLFAGAGVDCLHVSGGVIDRLVTRMVSGSHEPDATNVAAAAAVKRAVDIPVMVVGRIHDPDLAERIVREGQADLVALARPLLADAEFARKLASGRANRIRRCISCQNCIDSMEQRLAMDCAVNPASGREAELAETPATTQRHVLVVGGGPGGLEAARVAALRGHRVSLHERGERLGGALALAATVHAENEPLLHWLCAEVRRLGVDVRLGSEIDVERAVGLAPDAVVVATGGGLRTPAIEGAALPHVWSGAELRSLARGRPDSSMRNKLPPWQRLGLALAGPALARRASPDRLRRWTRRWLPIGRRVVLVGADLAAVELAEFLAERGREVSILEPGDSIAPEVGLKRRTEHMDRLDRAGIPVNTGVRIARITPEAVEILRPLGGSLRIPADWVLLAGEVVPDTRLADALAERFDEVHRVGDCTGLGLIQKAVLDGARAGHAV